MSLLREKYTGVGNKDGSIRRADAEEKKASTHSYVITKISNLLMSRNEKKKKPTIRITLKEGWNFQTC